MKARKFEAAFDAGEDVSAAVDWSKARRRNEEMRRVSVDLPERMMEALDRQARERGVTRAELIGMWVGERIEMRLKP